MTQLPCLVAEKTRLDSVQMLRGLAAGMVVWWHAVENIVTRESTYKAAKESLFLPREFYALGAAGVDIFFVISGFVMLYSMWDGFARPHSPLGFLKKRWLRIFPTYWLFLLLTQTVQVLHHAYGTGVAPDWPRFFYSLALLPTVPDFEGYTLGQAWTLTYELFFYSVFALGLLWRKSRGIAVVGLTLVALVCSAAPLAALGRSIAWTPAYPLSLVLGSDLMLEFLLGMGVAMAFKRDCLCPLSWLPLGWAGVCGLVVLFYLGIALPGLPARAAAMGLPCMLTIWLCLSWEKQRPGRVPPPVPRLGRQLLYRLSGA